MSNNKKELMQQHSLTDSKYEYELKRSNKKGMEISEWLFEKYDTTLADITLYHFTKQYNVPKILKWGVMVGDVMTGSMEGFNAPNLTAESQNHDPNSARGSNTLLNNEAFMPIRIEIKLAGDDKKLFNYGIFDKQHCGGLNAQLANKNPSQYGDLSRQYIYKGVIEPTMIEGFDRWNEKKQEFVRLSLEETTVIVNEFEGLYSNVPDYLRLSGQKMKDWTGKLDKYYAETDKENPFGTLYLLSDWICSNSQTKHKRVLEPFIENIIKSAGKADHLIYHVINCYNIMADPCNKPKGALSDEVFIGADRLDEEAFLSDLRYNLKEVDDKWKNFEVKK